MTSVTGPSRATPERTVPGLTPAMRGRVRWLFRIVSAFSPALAARLAMRAFLTPLARPIEPEEAQFLGSAQSQTLGTAGGALQVYTWTAATPDAPTVLLVHGWISHAARMADLIRALHERGLRVVAFDAPAHGRSGGTQADMHGFRAAIQAVMSHCGPVHGVLAHSFGALSTASWLAEHRPGTMRAVVLVGMMRDLGYIFDSFTQALALRPAVSARFRELIRDRYGAYPEDVSTGEMVRRLHLPVLLVHGAADDIVPSDHAHVLSKELRAGQLLIAPDLGHGAPLRDPATVRQIVDFLGLQLAP
ncbi:MAG TPA: alpha/beta fold hydrolase [Steroidobacteraceae bacterium]|nr:alpha/beta fold hydrolase [Steroidobacteraceae bacterium]